MGNHANKRAAAAAHNARYAEREAIRPNITKSPGQTVAKKVEPVSSEPVKPVVKPKRCWFGAILAAFMPVSLRG
ncbi:hypothetical protein [Shewanella putrefaciens]|uniref:hypothetical protein n=1 Tax=Shewanella putrefaciens TaxID=24 RepID=UPI0018E7E76C|nr:hypothetical protein [Shewanella putrefaciens]